MQKTRLKLLNRILITLLIAIPVLFIIGYSMDARVHYDDNPLALNWNNEGPYIFLNPDSTLNINYIKGNAKNGYYFEQKDVSPDSIISATSYFPLDSTSFDFTITTKFKTPKSIYNDGNKILALSDIESNYKAFRDFLVKSKVIDENLNWTFSDGHLVLVGDFVDRGYFTTQVLWFIYKLEQEAEKKGGFVHYIIGNHELKMMHGNYGSTDPKYNEIASILGKQQIELYNSATLLGKWMASKNAIELINGNLFVHGGIHPDLANSKLNIDEINQIIRLNYFSVFNSKNTKPEEELFISTKTGPCWYRGYFKDDLKQAQIETTLRKFNANKVIVGHTLQSKVNSLYSGKIIAIDVHHPNDDHKLWPEGKSEALLIDQDSYFRVFDNGEKEVLKID